MTNQLENRLLRIAAFFLVLFASILTLSNAVRERTWMVDFRWQHWIALIIWGLIFYLLHRTLLRYLPSHDPFLLPISALLSGWGLLTIWRLAPNFGIRQTFWLCFAAAVVFLAVRFRLELELLRRYKYLLLVFGLCLTALTIIFGTNPGGAGPELWLGCCGIYLQPSEPLKLLLIIYLSAYLADRLPTRNRLIPLLFPTLILTGLALLLLLFQRDLGTASIFILLYAAIVFLGTGHRRVLVFSTGLLALAGFAGYYIIGLIRLRIDSWLNPWLDPSGQSYQIIQSLLAIANGGIIGRGPGLGSPTLVPISHSDFIFTAIAEELGLIGVIGMLVLFALLISRGSQIAMRSPDRFQRLLAIGITSYFSIQSLLIIGGNLRVLPLTGVTLPFVSYGGSSLVTSFIAILALILISHRIEEDPAPLPDPSPYYIINGIIGMGFLAMSIGAGWWVLVRGSDLLTRTDNARRSISDRYVKRGDLVDRNNFPINITVGQTGDYTREYLHRDLGPVAGYNHPVYGQAGLEASMDEYLRGLKGNPASFIWWDRLLYGTPPPGIDIRLSIDLSLQAQADALLVNHSGAIVILNARSGEVLVMASHPVFDPNLLDEEGQNLSKDIQAPLLNRATQGSYSPTSALEPFFLIVTGQSHPATPEDHSKLYRLLGFYDSPAIRLPIAEAGKVQDPLRISPLQMALAAAAISNNGIAPAPRMAIAANTPQEGWVVLPALDNTREIFTADHANETARSLANNNLYWMFTGANESESLTWNIAGTLPGWNGTPLVITTLIEENNPGLARQIGERLLTNSLNP